MIKKWLNCFTLVVLTTNTKSIDFCQIINQVCKSKLKVKKWSSLEKYGLEVKINKKIEIEVKIEYC